MKEILPGLVPFLCYFSHPSPNTMHTEAIKDGRLLFQTAMASVYGADLYEKRMETNNNIGGHFAYIDNGNPTCIFFSKRQPVTVVGAVVFNNGFDLKKVTVDNTARNFSGLEKEIFTLQHTALIRLHCDPLFKKYPRTTFIPLPVIAPDRRQVYVLTSSLKTDEVIFGNDYVMNFSNDNKLVSSVKLHGTINRLDAKNEKTRAGKFATTSIHQHSAETGDEITSTDVCTIMLNENMAHWSRHIILSENKATIWNCKTDDVVVLSRENWRRLEKREATE